MPLSRAGYCVNEEGGLYCRVLDLKSREEAKGQQREGKDEDGDREVLLRLWVGMKWLCR